MNTNNNLLKVLGVALLIVAAGGYYFWSETKKTAYVPAVVTPPLVKPSPPPPTHPTADPTESWKTFSNTQFGIEFKYPENYDDYKISVQDGTTIKVVDQKGETLLEFSKGAPLRLPAAKWEPRTMNGVVWNKYFGDARTSYTYQVGTIKLTTKAVNELLTERILMTFKLTQ